MLLPDDKDDKKRKKEKFYEIRGVSPDCVAKLLQRLRSNVLRWIPIFSSDSKYSKSFFEFGRVFWNIFSGARLVLFL